jgi:RNA polymerase sigma factor (sigma-70 family)
MFSYQIIEGLKKGKPKIQSLVWKKYFSQVFSSIRVLTQGSPEAEDMATEIMGKVFLVEKPFESLEQISGFLFEAVKNKCSNFRKKQMRIAESNSEEVRQYYESLGSEDLEDAETVALLRSKIQTGINGLPTKCRQVFMLYYTRSLKNREIAEELGISEKAVEKQKTKAFKKLKMEIRVKNGIIVSIIFL